MRQRHVAAGIAALLSLVISAGAALAGGPATATGHADWVEEGTSRTFDLADGAGFTRSRFERIDQVPRLRPRRRSAPLPATGSTITAVRSSRPSAPSRSTGRPRRSTPAGPQPGTSGTATADGSLVGYFLSQPRRIAVLQHQHDVLDTVGGGQSVANSLGYAGYWADNASAPSGSQNVSRCGDPGGDHERLRPRASSPTIRSTVYAVFSSGAVNLGGGAFTQYCAYHGVLHAGTATRSCTR